MRKAGAKLSAELRLEMVGLGEVRISGVRPGDQAANRAGAADS
jgi:hypothetical protein